MSRKNILVTLSEEECMQAAVLGAARRIKSKTAGLRDNHGLTGGKGWDLDIEGAMAEMAMAKAMGVYFDPTVGTFKAPDVVSRSGAGVQVRSTTRKDGRLIVRDPDPDDELYVLVISALPRFRIVGWMRGGDAKQDRYKTAPDRGPRKRKPAYFVPQKDLQPFSKL